MIEEEEEFLDAVEDFEHDIGIICHCLKFSSFIRGCAKSVTVKGCFGAISQLLTVLRTILCVFLLKINQNTPSW